LFYPDFLERTSPLARITLDLQQLLIEFTGDHDWPQQANEQHYADLIKTHLREVLQAHKNLRTAHQTRFSDADFQTVVAYAALGIAGNAFEKLNAADYWRVGLLGQRELRNLETLTPHITKPIKEILSKAPAPFCWFGQYDPETVLRAFYLSVILAQHHRDWHLLLSQADASLSHLNTISQETLQEAVQKLVDLAPERAHTDLQEIEEKLTSEALQRLLLDALRLTEPEAAASLIEKEQYSTLFRNFALLLGLDNLLSPHIHEQVRKRIEAVLYAPQGGRFVDQRVSLAWTELQDAYRLAGAIQDARAELGRSLKRIKMALRNAPKTLTFVTFREIWKTANISRLEYYLSALKRLVYHADLLERQPANVPAVFNEACVRIQGRVEIIEKEVFTQLSEINTFFQDLVAQQYPQWLTSDGEVYLSSQFIRRCLKPNWDPQREKAVVLLFDGMRYDIWDELLRPTLLDRMNIIQELPASSILPSETHVSRWAIAAGEEPEKFGAKRRPAENNLLQKALLRDLNYPVQVEVIPPDGTGTGETVRYRAGNLLYYIFEFCDKELHKIGMKKLPDGRLEPSRPLSFVYQQYIKNFIDTEVMAIVRQLEPGTKVFIVADHGFGRVGQEWLGIDPLDLNENNDCVYLHTILKVPFSSARLYKKERDNSISFTTEQLRYPRQETFQRHNGDEVEYQYRTILFPKMGYSFSRQGSPYHPAAYGHGGISLQELLIPMVVLQVKERGEEFLTLRAMQGPTEIVEGEEAEFRMRLTRGGGKSRAAQELRVDVEASYRGSDEAQEAVVLPQQVLYVTQQGADIVYRFRPDPDQATADERQQGVMQRALALVVHYQEGDHATRKAQIHQFAVRLNSERIVRRVPTSLGSILGLTPKGIR
ncbi:MAG: PglZ domain-containing protein, partial [Ktedonobacteraceae bacterium]